MLAAKHLHRSLLPSQCLLPLPRAAATLPPLPPFPLCHPSPSATLPPLPHTQAPSKRSVAAAAKAAASRPLEQSELAGIAQVIFKGSIDCKVQALGFKLQARLGFNGLGVQASKY